MLCDFGFTSELHGHGFLIAEAGTPGYMAPEIWNARYGIPYQGTDADLFAMGVLLFIAMFKKFPFQKASLEDPKYVALIGRGDPDYWPNVATNRCTAAFVNLIMNMLQFEPSARLSITDLIGHPWLRQQAMTDEEFTQQV